MEKINVGNIPLEDNSNETALSILLLQSKINEIIDELDRLKTLEDKIEKLWSKHELSDNEIKFIMKNGAGLKEVILKSGSETLSHYETAPLQDLWDEQNEPKISDIGEIEKHPTCKHTPIYSGKCCKECEPTVKECNCSISDYTDIEDGEQCFICHRKIKKPSVKECDSKGNIVMNSNPLVDELLEKYNKDQKIEEIISGTKDYLSCVDEDNCTGADNCECLYHKFESWLRDKLKSL